MRGKYERKHIHFYQVLLKIDRARYHLKGQIIYTKSRLSGYFCFQNITDKNKIRKLYVELSNVIEFSFKTLQIILRACQLQRNPQNT